MGKAAGSRILGTGRHLPAQVVTNDDLAQRFDTSDEWIQQRTGIRERRFSREGEGTAALAEAASRAALADAGLGVPDIDFLIVATLSPEHFFPGTSAFLQERLGCPGIGAMDVRNQCTGFVYSLAVADAFVKTGQARRVLVVGSEVHSTGLDYSDQGRDVTVLFGDGAGAVIVGATEDPARGILTTKLHCDGRFARELWVDAPASAAFPARIDDEMLRAGRQYPQMNGKLVFKHAVEALPAVIQEALDDTGHTLAQVDLLVPHQANMRINQVVAQRLGFDPDKVVHNIDRYGNTTAGSIPIAIDEAREQGRLKDGDLVMLAAFGSGFTWASALIRW